MALITIRQLIPPEKMTENPGQAIPADQLSLPFSRRQISRQRVVLASGHEAALKMPRGCLLRGGDLLLSDQDEVIQVIAAAESVSIVRANNQHDLVRAAYHLGNRHVSVEVGDGWLAYLHDHVLDDMVRGLGDLDIGHTEQSFEPEAGAYHGHSHGRHEH